MSFACACLASENGATTVKVGFFAFDGYHEQDGIGERSGYGYELLQYIAGYADFRYEYVGYDKNWSQMQEMLLNGEIDILTSAQKTPEREAFFDFSETSVGTSSAILTVKAGDDRFVLSDYDNWTGIRVGMIQGSSRNASFADYAAKNGFDYASVFFDDAGEMVAELKRDGSDRKIDAILTSNLRKIEDEWVLAEFDPSPFYVTVKKGNTEILSRVNDAIEQIDANMPGFRSRLMAKYYTPSTGGEIAFSPEERAYIKSMRGKTLIGVINPDRAPYSWSDNGTLKGVIYDAAVRMIARSGLSVRFLEVKDRNEYSKAIENGLADIRFDATYSPNQAERDGYWLTRAYITVPVARVHRKDASRYLTAAAPLNRDITSTYARDMAKNGLSVEFYPSVADTVQAVMTGKRDVALLVLDEAYLSVRNDVTNKLVVDEVYGDERSYAVAVNQNRPSALYSVFYKVASSITEQEIGDIRQAYAADLKKPFSLIGFFYQNPLYIFIGSLVALGIIVLIIALNSLGKRRAIEHEHLEKEKMQNERLKDALNAAEKAGAAKSQFLSRMSHEMRTPLNAIIGFIQLADGANEEYTRNCLASCDVASRQLLSVINDVLDMSSIESGKLAIASQPFNLRNLLSSITNIYGAQCDQKGVDFETKLLTPTQDWLVGDELRVNQILINLLGNAVKFTSRGRIRLMVSQSTMQDDGVLMRFQVSDTGCGMSRDMKSRLFMPFEQQSASVSRMYGGSGLGLSIVKNLVELMSGSINAQSEEGKGSSFTVEIPFVRSEKENQSLLPGSAGSLRILVIDDDGERRDYMDTVLSHMGVRHGLAADAEEALPQLRKSEKAKDLYNVCLITRDIGGTDIVKRIREVYPSGAVVIAVSAYDFRQDARAAALDGADMFISKPVFQSSVFDLIMKLAGGKSDALKEDRTKWNFAGKRVLLAEDNELNQIVAKGHLARFNVAADLAENGKIAVDKFLRGEPGYYDAILMDIQMPVMDGYEAAKAIRESNRPDAKAVPIIAQTADAFNEDIKKVLSAGMNSHVPKPVDPELLAKALNDAFTPQNDS